MLIIALSILFVLFVAGVALTIKDAHTVETEDVYINETDAGKFTKNHHIQEIL
jgi:capsular polysaccharide biosynthesis protein